MLAINSPFMGPVTVLLLWFFDHVRRHLAELDHKLEAIGQEIQVLAQRIDGTSKRIDGTDQSIDNLGRDHNEMHKQLISMESKL